MSIPTLEVILLPVEHHRSETFVQARVPTGCHTATKQWLGLVAAISGRKMTAPALFRFGT